MKNLVETSRCEKAHKCRGGVKITSANVTPPPSLIRILQDFNAGSKPKYSSPC